MFVLGERGKPKYPEKTCRSKVENQLTKPTYYAGSGNQTRDTLVEGERSYHCEIPAPHSVYVNIVLLFKCARSLDGMHDVNSKRNG